MAIAALSLPLLHGCGGGGDDSGGGDGAVRLVNAAEGYASLDLYANDTEISSAVSLDSAGDYSTLGSGTYTFKLKRAGSGTTAGSASRTVSGGTSYSLLAYTTADSLRSVLLSETEAAPSAGAAKLRVFNGSVEAGTLDVYVTEPTADLNASSPTVSSIGTERVSSYNEISAGTYRIRVTGAGDKSDLRLDLPSVTLDDQQITTLVLTSTPGGVLVHAMTLDQKGDVAARKNPSARVRLVASAASNGSAVASVNGVDLSDALQSPTVGNYVLVPAGAATFDVTLDGQPVTAPGSTLVAGSDNTLLVTSDAGTGAVTVLSDDNRPPLSATNAKIRLVHGVGSLASSMTMSVDFRSVAAGVARRTASSPTSVTATTTGRIQATTPALVDPLYLETDITLQAGRVYTLFVLDGRTAATGVLNLDR